MSVPTTIAPVGITGGVSTTRLSLELAAVLVADGRDVTTLDVVFATQGLSDYVSKTLDPDAAAFVIDATDMSLEPGLVAFETDAKGRITVCPTATPLERLAWAMTPDAARAFEGRIAEAANGFDHVLVDASFLTSNQMTAAAAACDRVALVTSVMDRSTDAVGRLSVWTAGIDTDIDAVVSTFDVLDNADVIMPETEVTGFAGAPAYCEDAKLAAGVAAVAGALLDIEIDAVATTDDVLGSVSECVCR